jgi:hypothetical protein
VRDGGGREGSRHGNLHDARHAHGEPGAQAEGCRARLLQSQHRHLARALRQHHHHAHLRGPAGNAAAAYWESARASATVPPCCARSPICPCTPRACPSTC